MEWCVFPMEIYHNWFAIMDLTVRQICHEVGQPTLDMFIYLSPGARLMGPAKVQVSIGKSLPICILHGKIGLSTPRILPYVLSLSLFLSRTSLSGNPSLPSFYVPLEAILGRVWSGHISARRWCGFIWIL